MTLANQHINPDDIQRLEKKLDMIIDFFNIDKQARRSKKDLKAHADLIILDLQKKAQRHNK